MAVKYICPVCGRRFVDWGAEKLGFKCPTEECKEATLVLFGTGGDDQDDKPSLKRSRKRKAIVPSVAPDIDITDMDGSFADSEDAEVEEEEEDDVELDEEEDIVAIKSVEDDVVDDDVLLDDDAVVDDEDDDTFTDALDIEADDVPLDED